MRKSKKILCLLLMALFSLFLISCGKTTKASNTPVAETISQTTQTEDNQIETYFTRKDGNLDQILIKEINTAQKNLDVAIYSLTKENIANAIIEAKKRNVDVNVITDKQESQSKYQKAILDKFKSNNIPVKINSHVGLMHLKLSIIDDKTALGGSYNYTANATKENDENLIIMRNPNIVADYSTEFTTMWDNTSDYSNY